MTILFDDLLNTLSMSSHVNRLRPQRELNVHKFGDGRVELMIREHGEKRCKLCSMELSKEQISALGDFLMFGNVAGKDVLVKSKCKKTKMSAVNVGVLR